MRNYLLIICICVLVVSCGRIKYIPVENIKTEYRDRVDIQKDSIYYSDTVRIIERGDTIKIYRDRWRTVYKDRLVRDTFVKQDTIIKPYPVDVVKYRVPDIMWWLILCLLAFSAPSIWKIVRRFL